MMDINDVGELPSFFDSVSQNIIFLAQLLLLQVVYLKVEYSVVVYLDAAVFLLTVYYRLFVLVQQACWMFVSLFF